MAHSTPNPSRLGLRQAAGVRTVVLGPRPTEPEELIRRRRRLGIDTFDDVRESYDVEPAAHATHGCVTTG
jgi:hypothetical protein